MATLPHAFYAHAGKTQCRLVSAWIRTGFAEAAITCLIGAILLEQSDEWATQRARCMTLETIGNVSDNSIGACPPWQDDVAAQFAGEHNACTTPWGTVQFSQIHSEKSDSAAWNRTQSIAVSQFGDSSISRPNACDR